MQNGSAFSALMLTEFNLIIREVLAEVLAAYYLPSPLGTIFFQADSYSKDVGESIIFWKARSPYQLWYWPKSLAQTLICSTSPSSYNPE